MSAFSLGLVAKSSICCVGLAAQGVASELGVGRLISCFLRMYLKGALAMFFVGCQFFTGGISCQELHLSCWFGGAGCCD